MEITKRKTFVYKKMVERSKPGNSVSNEKNKIGLFVLIIQLVLQFFSFNLSG
jgi:hypothetical protein